ncbi:MAG: 3-mercaptopyruvate sulfurtransferase, partial [Alphaproteobacteria bacterium MarineAlpha9_Bin4]
MLINAHWLKKNIKKSNLKILDCSWYLPNSKRNAKKEFINMRIPGAIFFDIDDICDKKSNFPHMLPSYKYFENKISDLGINTEDILVIYCKEGVLSSPRVWWMFKYFGHKEVFVLNGGLKAWMLANGMINYGPINIKKTKYKVKRVNVNFNSTYEEIMEMKKYKERFNILDARPKNRFLELEEEPRENIGRGK